MARDSASNSGGPTDSMHHQDGGESFWQPTEDWHTAGEPFRIVERLPGGSLTQGCSVADQRLKVLRTPNHPLDLLRQSLCHEPRGHADMYGGFIVPPNDNGAHFGVLFWHREGFSTACGHGTIALGCWAVMNGIVDPVDDGYAEVVIDVPSGRVTAYAFCRNNKVMHVDFVNVPSYQISKDLPMAIDLDGKTLNIKADLAYGGAVYAFVNVADLNLKLELAYLRQFVDIQRQIKATMKDFRHLEHYDIYGVCFFEQISDTAKSIEQRNVVVFANGQIDRSPCGSGTAARLSVLLAEGKVGVNKPLIHHSILGTVFEASVDGITNGGSSYPALIPRIRGTAQLVGQMNFYIDPEDTLYPGFLCL